jgi:hypothetical protein
MAVELSKYGLLRAPSYATPPSATPDPSLLPSSGKLIKHCQSRTASLWANLLDIKRLKSGRSSMLGLDPVLPRHWRTYWHKTLPVAYIPISDHAGPKQVKVTWYPTALGSISCTSELLCDAKGTTPVQPRHPLSSCPPVGEGRWAHRFHALASLCVCVEWYLSTPPTPTTTTTSTRPATSMHEMSTSAPCQVDRSVNTFHAHHQPLQRQINDLTAQPPSLISPLAEVGSQMNASEHKYHHSLR